jgi:hypothetical protein
MGDLEWIIAGVIAGTILGWMLILIF